MLRHGARRRSDQGSVVVEFALVIPLVFAVMFGVIQYGVYFWGAPPRPPARARPPASSPLAPTGPAATTRRSPRPRAPDRGSRDHAGYLNESTRRRVGDLVEVTVTGSAYAPSLLPLPDGGAITEVASARVENIPPTPLSCR